MKHIALCFSLIITSSYITASNLVISDISHDATENTLTFDVSWDNGFRVAGTMEDLVYIFVKYRNSDDPKWHTMRFPLSGHTLDVSGSVAFITRADELDVTQEVGWRALEIRHGSTFTTGPTDVTATISLLPATPLLNPSFRVFGIEMVQSIPEFTIDYYIGDGSSANRFCKGNDPSSPFFIDFVPHILTPVQVGTGPEDISTTSATPLPVNEIPGAYFKPGYICMRYEITQKQYVDFLNCLSREAQNTRTESDISGTTVVNRYVMSASFLMINRNGIKCDGTLPADGPVTFYCDLDGDDIPNEDNDGQSIAANFLSPGDLLAYLDWVGIKPMNEIQYEFFSRGTALPISGEYAWASAVKTAATLNISQSGGADETPTNIGAAGLYRRSNDPMRTGACATSTSNRLQAGSSFSGIMDLSGNVAELVVGSYSLEDFANYDFPGLIVGDGQLTEQGDHNELWPDLLVTKGLATSSNINSVSHRHPGSFPYIGVDTRLATNGGRGIYGL